ncbi:MAG: PAS domain S-box protein [Anaerolineae bacterium]|nr:PAS domain S-box protein [Anaerolineae bacterium]
MSSIKLERVFRRTYTWALLITALISSVTYYLLINVSNAQLETAQRSDLALDVRTAMHSMAFLANRLVIVTEDTARDAIRQEMLANVQRMSDTYNRLLAAARTPQVIAIHLQPPYHLAEETASFLESVRELTKLPVITAETPAYQHVITLRPVLLDGLNRLADQYSLESEVMVHDSQRIETALILLMLLTLGVEVVFIFRPMEHLIVTTQNALRAEAERSQAAAFALRDSETRYRQMFENNPAVKLLIDPQDGRIVEANHAASEFYGYPLDKLKTLTVMDINVLPPQTVIAIRDRILTGPSGVNQGHHRLASGETRHVEVFAGPLSLNNRTYVYAIIQDISQRKQAEDALRENENRFRTLFEQNSDGIFILGLDGKLLAMNQSAVDLVGYSRDEIDEYPIPQLSAETSPSLQVVDRLIAGEHLPIYERLFRRKNGEVFPVEINAALVRASDGTPLHIQSIVRDISQRKQAERALRESEQRLRLITDNVLDIITQIDGENLIRFASSSYTSILGYEPASILGLSGISLIYPDDVEQFRQAIAAVRAKPNERIAIEGRLVHRDGHALWTETVGTLLFGENGTPNGGVFVTRDITERKRLEQALIEQEKLRTELEKELELSTLKSRMMEIIAHEFRTPLAVIQLTLGTLADYYDRITVEQRAVKFGVINERIQRIADMLSELDIIVRGGFTPSAVQRAPVDLVALCRKVVANLEAEYRVSGRYTLEFATPATIYADPFILINAIRHVLANAALFSPADTPVKVSLTPLQHGFELSVIDTGIGIPADDLPRLFQPFFRGSNIGTLGGLGLGLTIAQAAIHAHQGTIKVESVAGQGTTVKLWVPTTV